ncbi:hypothetical protein A2Z67_02645 [Candidatus Woesebacteria bacterium RBG_13_36_22]|uniref:Uncharacterized protein n=1 Tax=Candidatus Woesebacteria bacterium RBG_13_36_22 TaxID=1802478 RepID=A0A1F7X1A2_9BACT|nr:MAG: hypothetical protein A2Z67_02645 [Candidatus Woesebacteria bacterium RBG_13_36_22]
MYTIDPFQIPLTGYRVPSSLYGMSTWGKKFYGPEQLGINVYGGLQPEQYYDIYTGGMTGTKPVRPSYTAEPIVQQTEYGSEGYIPRETPGANQTPGIDQTTKDLNTASTITGIGGSVLSAIPYTAPIGIALNVASTLLGIGNAVRSSNLADKMTSPQLPAPKEVKKPYLGVTAGEYGAQQSMLKNLYASTIRQGQLLGKDVSTGALAQILDAERQISARNEEIKRQAAIQGIGVEQFNIQQRQQWGGVKAGYDWQTEAMKAGIKSEAMQTGVQGVLNLGQSLVSYGNYKTSMQYRVPELYSAMNQAIINGDIDSVKYLQSIINSITGGNS